MTGEAEQRESPAERFRRLNADPEFQAVDGGLNPRISGGEAKIGTGFAVKSLASSWLGGQASVNAASRRRRWPKASVYRGLSPRSESSVEVGGCLHLTGRSDGR